MEVITVLILLSFYHPNSAADLVETVQKAANLFDTSDTVKSTLNELDSSNITTQETLILSSGPDIPRSKKYVYLTGAMYCSDLDLSKWECDYCKKSQSLGYDYSGNFTNIAANTFGLVVVNKADKEIVLVFRGTYNLENTLQDLSLTKIDPTGDGSKLKNKSFQQQNKEKSSTLKVHSGFIKATKSLYPQVVEKLHALLKKNKGFNVILTGHSLGASMATVTLYMLQQRMNVPSTFPNPAYALFAYGQPRTGNQAFADYWNSQKIPATRIVSKADIIPHMPSASMGYVHQGTELWISPNEGDKSCSKSVYEDPTCSNSQGPVYLASDHVQYWDVTYLVECASKNPIPVLKQFVILE